MTRGQTSTPWKTETPFDPLYIERTILELAPSNLVGFWRHTELSGVVSLDISGHNHDGAYTAVTLGRPGVPGTGKGATSAGYDGAASYNNIYSAGLANDSTLLNGGFETAGAGDPDFWANWNETKGDGALANEVVIVHEGVDSAKMTSGATSNTNVMSDAMVSVPGDVDRLRFFTYGDGANAGRYGIYDITNGVYIVPLTSTGITAEVWGMVPVQYTVPAGCVSVRVEYWCPPVNGGVCYFDAGEVRGMDGFLGDEGTLLAWAKVSAAGVWTDGENRYIVHLKVDNDNYICIKKDDVNNKLQFDYMAGGVLETYSETLISETGWIEVGMTWSKSEDAVKYYYSGLLKQTDTALGVWTGDLLNLTATVGAANITPASVWLGDVGPVPLWNRELTADQIESLFPFTSSYGIFAIGDSKTDDDIWVELLANRLGVAVGCVVTERPTRFGIAGIKTAGMKTYIDDNLSDTTGECKWIVINLGANDVKAPMPTEANWKSNTVSIIDSLQAKFRGVPIYLTKAWRRDYTPDCNTVAGWLDDVLALYSEGVFVGPDERVWLENGDDGATYTIAGTHYNFVGNHQAAAQWQSVLGY